MKVSVTVNPTPLVIDIKDKENKGTIRQIVKETWPLRRAIYRKQGIDQMYVSFLPIDLDKWIKDVAGDNPHQPNDMAVFIDFSYIAAIVRLVAKTRQYINFVEFYDKLDKMPFALHNPIYYFSRRATEGVANFHEALRRTGKYDVIVKYINTGYVTIPGHNLPHGGDDSSAQDIRYESIASFVCTSLLKAYYEHNIDNVLVISRDADIIPALELLKSNGVKITIPVADRVSISSHLLKCADYIINAAELFNRLDCFSKNEKPVEPQEIKHESEE